MSDTSRNTARAHRLLKEFLGAERYREFLREKQKKDAVSPAHRRSKTASMYNMINVAFHWGSSYGGARRWSAISLKWGRYCRDKNIYWLQIFR